MISVLLLVEITGGKYTLYQIWWFVVQSSCRFRFVRLYLNSSISCGSIAGQAAVRNNLAVVWVDAHPDINTAETTPSGNLHGMVASLLLQHISVSKCSCRHVGPFDLYCVCCLLSSLLGQETLSGAIQSFHLTKSFTLV